MTDKDNEQAASINSESENTAAGDAPLPVETPKMETAAGGGEAEKIGPFLPVLFTAPHSAEEAPEIDSSTAQQAPRRGLSAYTSLAAGLAFAFVVGGLAGSAATMSLKHDPSPEISSATRALQDSVAQLGRELISLKAGIAASQRTATAQFGKMAERLDRAEKSQAEPATKLARLQESIDKLDQRQQQQQHAAVAAAPAVTGSVVAKEESKPPVLDGWRLRDFYAGRAIVENRSGTLFEIGPGASVPGLGKVETIKRDNGRVTVVTSNGTLTAALEPRRPAYGLPYRY